MSFVWIWPAQNKEDTVRGNITQVPTFLSLKIKHVDGTLPAVVYTK